MKLTIFALLLLLCFSCKNSSETTPKKAAASLSNRVIKPEFQKIIDAADVQGSLLIYDLNKDRYYSNDFEWADRGNLPASTFKIANSIIGLETGVIEHDSTVFKWDGKKKLLKNWEQDLVLRDAFQFSCVPCYQQVARKIGAKRMNDYVSKLNYGNLKIDANTIDQFWLEGASKISQMQQIDFLKRLYKNELPISKRTSEIVKRIMLVEAKDQYQLRGKTGLSMDKQVYNGWYVGYLEIPQHTYFFATNVEPLEEFDFNTFIKKRIDLTKSAFKMMQVLH